MRTDCFCAFLKILWEFTPQTTIIRTKPELASVDYVRLYMLSRSYAFVQTKCNNCRSVGLNLIAVRNLTANILIVGRKHGGDAWIDEGCNQYETRLLNTLKVHSTFVKNNDDLISLAAKSKCPVFALDETGTEYTSNEFSRMVYKSFEKNGAQITFIIGGFDGLPLEIRSKFPLISLSKLTWTHQMARLLLVEQIYRATEIHKGSRYHKE